MPPQTSPATPAPVDMSDVAAALDYADEHTAARVEPLDRWEVDAPAVFLVDQHKDRVVEARDLEAFLPAPRRNHGTTKAHTPTSLVEYVTRVNAPSFDLYANIDQLAAIVVLNPARSDDAGPAWQDHRATLAYRRHPAWQRWVDVDGHLLDQEQFAIHVQENASAIADPPALDLLEIAETLTLNVGARVSSAVRLRDGQRHLIFDETVEATAGHAREVDIPERISLRVPIFEGCDPEEVTVRLLYRQDRGAVKFMVQIVDRADRERETFTDSVRLIGEQLDTEPIFGVPS